MAEARMTGQPGFFDAEERLRWLSASGDPLERLRAVVDFEAFRAELEAALPRADRSRTPRIIWFLGAGECRGWP
jgi:IS5 family transposase